MAVEVCLQHAFLKQGKEQLKRENNASKEKGRCGEAGEYAEWLLLNLNVGERSHSILVILLFPLQQVSTAQAVPQLGEVHPGERLVDPMTGLGRGMSCDDS